MKNSNSVYLCVIIKSVVKSIKDEMNIAYMTIWTSSLTNWNSTTGAMPLHGSKDHHHFEGARIRNVLSKSDTLSKVIEKIMNFIHNVYLQYVA